MNGRKAQMGIILFCALALCALGATSASAATSGTTAVTCVDTSPTNNGDYTDEHCDTTGTLEKSRYKHVTIAQDTGTKVTGSNSKTKSNTSESTAAVLSATIGGVNLEVVCTNIHSEGTLENKLVGEEHKIMGKGLVGVLAGCTVTKPSGCVIHTPGRPAGEGVSNNLKTESVEGTPMTRKITPESGEKFGEYILEGAGCACAGTYGVTGTVSIEPSGQMVNGSGKASTGATLTINIPKNASSTLVTGGQKAGLTLTETIQAPSGNPIASTGPPF